MARNKGKLSELWDQVRLYKELKSVMAAEKSDDDEDNLKVKPSPRGKWGEKADTWESKSAAAGVERQASPEDQDQFGGLYGGSSLLIQPNWNPVTLKRIYEEGDVLGRCIRTIRDNVHRPHTFEYSGDKKKKTDPDVIARESFLKDFFSRVNESQSWLTLRRSVGLDTGISENGYCQVLREGKVRAGETKRRIQRMYHIPATYMRTTALDKEPFAVDMIFPRDGKLEPVKVHRRFRRFARILPGEKIEWFKQFGDPRIVERDDGEYVKNGSGGYLLEPAEYKNKATEIWWFRNVIPGDTYGTPVWVSALDSVRGRYLAGWVNYDTLDHGGAPPWLLVVFGRLAKGTRKYLTNLIETWRNPRVYSDPGIIEIEPNILGFSGSGQKAAAEFHSMRDMRAEEAMFPNYRQETKETIGQVFGLPGFLYGDVQGTGSSNYAALELAEDQVFAPIRETWDEMVNIELIQQEFGIFDWRIKTKASPIADKEAKGKAAGMAGRTGGPSMNELTELLNELFGTNWPTRDGWFYSDISAAEAVGMIRQGMVIYDPDTGKPQIIAPQTSAPVGAGFGNDFDFEALKTDTGAPVDISKMPLADAINLLVAMDQVEDAWKNYQPPDPEKVIAGFKM